MDQDKAQQSIDTLSEKVNGVVRSVRVSCSPENDYRGEKDYRSVFGVQEIECLYVDTEVLNKQFEGEPWEGKMTVRLFRLENGKGQCLSVKESGIKVERQDALPVYEEWIDRADLPEQAWKQGIYRILADIDGVAGQSEDLYIVPGEGKPEKYFRILHAGLDRFCEETESEAQKRPHSFRMFDATRLKNIRFFLMAQNLLGGEWVYEFVIRVVDRRGSIKAMQIVKSAQYIKDQAGNSILCFAVDLGSQEDFVTPGEYTVMVSCFGQTVLKMGYGIGHKDIPYDFEQEILADGGEVAVKQKLNPVYTAKDKDEILDRLYRLVGLRKVKEEITRIIEYVEFIRLRRENGFSDTFPQLHLIFTGYPGTGKNTVAEMVGELYQKLGLLSHGRVNHYSRRDLVREGTAAEEQLVRQALKNSMGGILFVDQAGDLFHPEDPNDRGVIALGILYGILTREKPEVLVVLSDIDEEMTVLLEAFPDLQKLFPRRLCFENYSPEELMEIARIKLEKLQFRFTPGAEEKFYKQLKIACRANEVDFTNGRYIDEQLEQASARMSARLMANRCGEYKKEDLMLITEEDIVTLPEGDPGKALEKLKAMIGLRALKQSIVQHLSYVYFIRERQKHGFDDTLPPLNMIFSGNPGTGKMTVAKMMGEIYHSVGILLRPNVTVQDGRQLTGDGGLTPQQGAEVLMNGAAGGILYIDHADVLPRSEWGLALFEALLSNLSTEECGDTIVVLGGYPERVDKMLEMNPALKNYFPYVFSFNDYTPEELMQIAENKLKEKAYVFDEEEIGRALEELDKMVGQTGIKKQIRDFVELARHYSHEGVKLSSRMSLQWCLTGNSAMGKGTVARIIARLYKAMGIVDKGQVFDFKVERMIGLMEDEAQRSIGEALVKSSGGILLFDEDSPKLNEAVGFRERVRALLMNQMAEHPGSYIIIYAEPRNRVSGINGDAEHMSDLVNVLVFEDYTKEELMIILKRRLEKERMKMTATARQYMTVFIGSLVATEERSHASSRLMRIVADLIVRNCLQRMAKSNRTSTVKEVISVQKQDVAMFTEAFVAGVMNERKRIGFI